MVVGQNKRQWGGVGVQERTQQAQPILLSAAYIHKASIL